MLYFIHQKCQYKVNDIIDKRIGGIKIDKTERKKKSNHIQSVEKALLILEVLAKEGTEMSLTEIAQKTCWPKSTVYGLISTLRDCHYVEQSADNGCYKLGIRLFELGNQVSRSWSILDAAHPVMMRLCKEIGETVQLGTEDRGEILYLQKFAPNSVVSIMSEVGIRLPMHCSGLGKVLLAQKNQSELKQYVLRKGLPTLTKKTITTFDKLEKELERVREKGYATDNGEITDGLRCIAAPIWDGSGQVKYAISVSGPILNMGEDRFEYIVKEVKQAAEEISYSMGYRKEDSKSLPNKRK